MFLPFLTSQAACMDEDRSTPVYQTSDPRRYAEAEGEQFGDVAEAEGRGPGHFEHSEGNIKGGAVDDYSVRGLFGDENYSRDSYGYGDAARSTQEYDGASNYRSFDLYSEAGESSFSLHNAEGMLEDDYDRRSFRGLGPEPSVYSDNHLKEIVSEELTEHPEIDASRFTVNVKNGEVFLDGHVESIDMKRYLDFFISDIRGVQDVHVNLKVKKGGA